MALGRVEGELVDDVRVPDAVSPVVAVRGWSTSQGLLRGERYQLISPLKSIVWESASLTAKCLMRHIPLTGDYAARRSVPGETCRCGIYARDSFDDNLPTATVYGVVELSGKVIPGSTGWRAEHATITGIFSFDLVMRELAFPPSLHPRHRKFLKKVARYYGVPLLDAVPALTPAPRSARSESFAWIPPEIMKAARQKYPHATKVIDPGGNIWTSGKSTPPSTSSHFHILLPDRAPILSPAERFNQTRRESNRRKFPHRYQSGCSCLDCVRTFGPKWPTGSV